MTTTAEHDAKIARLVDWMQRRRASAVVLVNRRNFAWLTGGGRNGVDTWREPGVGRLLVTADGRRYVLSSTIERDRLVDEEVGRLGYEPVTWPWTAEHATPTIVLDHVRPLVADASAVVADVPLPGITAADAEIVRLRAPLVPEEVARVRALGADAGRIVGEVARSVVPGERECDIAARTAAALAAAGLQAPVLMVAADDRIARFRHPITTTKPWTRLVMIVACPERHGLTVSLSRIVSAGAPDADIVRRTAATANVFHAMAAATRPGAVGRDVYQAAVEAYAAEGFAGEEGRHHQGGAAGYATREWVAHPASAEPLHAWQMFAWNPSITGTKVEDTILLTPDGPEMLTTTPGWPVDERPCGGGLVRAPLILAR